MAPYNPPVNVSHAEVIIPEYVSSYKIMRDLYYITEHSGCNYMWVDVPRKVVEIWGEGPALGRAIGITRRRISVLAQESLFMPREYSDLPEYLRLKIKVVAWKMNGFVNYKIDGSDSDVLTFIEILKFEYPVNPYCTFIKSRMNNSTVLSRLAVL
jgi:hypothetical protein